MKILLALCLLLAPMPIAAQVEIQRNVPVRYELLFRIAQYSCYRLRSDKKVEESVRKIRDSFRLTSNEVNLYLNYCMLYDQGYNRKIPK